MKKPLIYLFVLTLILIIAQPAQACEPCQEVLTLEETAAAADLVIIGEKVKNGPNVNGADSPDWIEVKVLEVLKGKVDQSTITVNSWNGMCAYGIIIEDKREYIIFLKQLDTPPGEIQYDAVAWGCAVRRYPIEDGIVIQEYEDQQIPLDDLLTQLGLERQSPPPEPIEDRETSGWHICPGWVLLLPLVGIAWKKESRLNKKSP